MLFVNTNINSLKGMGHLDDVTSRMNRSFEKLSSGSRINSARDDAAGLQISNRLNTQIIGLNQSNRNIQDGISAVQIADGAMSEITDIAFRMRQISVQMSSNTWSQEDRDGAQLEIDELIESANGIAEAASLGGKIPLLEGPDVDPTPSTDEYVLTRLSGMMEQSEAMVKAYFGIEGDGADEFDIVLDKPGAVGGTIAFVTYAGTDVINMTVDYADFIAPEPNALPIKYIDRVVAHEMTHAVMANQLSTAVMAGNTYDWFKEGTAELIHGADERLVGDIAAAGGADAMMSSFAGGPAAASIDYSHGFVAARMLHDEMKIAGHADGIRTFMQYLTQEGRTMDEAFSHFLDTNNADFVAHVASAGGAYITNNIDLTNEDTGGIGGLDADGMGIKDALNAVGDTKSYSEQPLNGFKINWPAGYTPPHKKTYSLHTGANSGERSEFSIRGGTAERIGLSGVNVSGNARASIEVIDKAIQNIHEIRSELGATQNALESHLRNNTNTVVNTSAARSRITDTDFASETAELTRNQIIQQASSSILAQANQTPNIALTLLGR